MGILTGIYHLQELPRYATEKPYTMRYAPVDGTAASNVLREKHDVDVHDMREEKAGYRLDRNGFTVCTLDAGMAYEIFDSQEKITTVYFCELEKILSKQFPGSTIDFVSYLVKKTSPIMLCIN